MLCFLLQLLHTSNSECNSKIVQILFNVLKYCNCASRIAHRYSCFPVYLVTITLVIWSFVIRKEYEIEISAFFFSVISWSSKNCKNKCDIPVVLVKPFPYLSALMGYAIDPL